MSWISVKEKLPEYGHYVLVFAKGNRMDVKFLIEGNYWYPGGTPLCNTTHWMVLPEYPKAIKNE